MTGVHHRPHKTISSVLFFFLLALSLSACAELNPIHVTDPDLVRVTTEIPIHEAARRTIAALQRSGHVVETTTFQQRDDQVILATDWSTKPGARMAREGVTAADVIFGNLAASLVSGAFAGAVGTIFGRRAADIAVKSPLIPVPLEGFDEPAATRAIVQVGRGDTTPTAILAQIFIRRDPVDTTSTRAREGSRSSAQEAAWDLYETIFRRGLSRPADRPGPRSTTSRRPQRRR